MYLLCNTNFIISYQNQPLILAIGGWLEEKNRPHQIGKLVGYLYNALCVLILVTCKQIYNKLDMQIGGAQ